MKLPSPMFFVRLAFSALLAAAPPIVSAALIMAIPARAVSGEAIPTPQSILGEDLAADYYLANYDDSIRYFRALENASERIKLFTAGETTQGREMVYSVISSPENLAQLENYKEISRRLGSADNLNDEQARELAQDAKIIVHIDGGLHSTEVAAHQLPIALAHKLLSAVDDAEVDAILDDVILVLWPTLNPDGQNMVVDWYREQRGTPFETSRLPWLYQEYVGHDNNRDGYMINMLESQAINRAQQDIAPVIWYTHHQTAPFPARIWMPPFADPVSSNISSLMRTWTGVIGMNMMARFETEGKPGAIAQGRFDNWYPGFVDYTHVFRHTISFFTEVAHDSATPKEYKLEDFPANKQDLRGLIMGPSPWAGGLWQLRDSVDYMVTASMSVLETATKYRETLLYNRYQAARNTIGHYADNGPYAYVIPTGQSDMPEAALLVQKMLDHGLSVHQAKQAISLGGHRYPAGSWMVLMDQSYAGLANELFGIQKFPDALLDGDGNPSRVPYDVTGWTLPLQMGVTVDRVDHAIGDNVRAALEPVSEIEFASGRILGEGSVFALSQKTNASYHALNDVLSEGGTVSLASENIETANGAEPSAFIVGDVERETLRAILQRHQIDATALTSMPVSASLSGARLGLYRPWGGNQYDAGWTRWLLEQYGFNSSSVYNTDVKAVELADRYDTIIIPDLADSRPLAKSDLEARMQQLDMPVPYRRKGSLGVLLDGLSPLEVPAPYAGGIGDNGGEALRKFVWEGGTIVALNKASDAIIDLFELPVTNVLRGLDSSEFSCAGALLQLELEESSTATGGMPDRPVVMFGGGPAFQTQAGFAGKVLASFAGVETLLQSGVIIGPDKIEGKSAALEVNYGQGRVYLFGFKPQWRGQSHGTYKMLFNVLYQYEDMQTDIVTASIPR